MTFELDPSGPSEYNSDVLEPKNIQITNICKISNIFTKNNYITQFDSDIFCLN